MTDRVREMIERLRARLLSATPAAPAPFYVEPDDRTRPGETMRLVSNDALSKRLRQGSSARPVYAATIYTRALASLVADAVNTLPELLDAAEETARLRTRVAELETERDAERLRYGQQRARCAVFMQAMAQLARTDWERAREWVQRADEASANVRLSDFVNAKPAGAEKGKPDGE